MVFGLAALLPGDLNPLRVQVFAFANSGFYLFKFFFFFFFFFDETSRIITQRVIYFRFVTSVYSRAYIIKLQSVLLF